jgi:small subunit ribosomal protein S20
MPNHKSAIKRMRQSEKLRLYNRSHRTRVRNYVKRARAALESGEVNAAEDGVRQAIRDLDKAASRGVLHKRNAARRKGRLMKQLAQLKQNS